MIFINIRFIKINFRFDGKTLIISISSDLLFTTEDQQLIHEHIPGSQLAMLDSFYGHDGFLLEFEKQKKIYKAFLNIE